MPLLHRDAQKPLCAEILVTRSKKFASPWVEFCSVPAMIQTHGELLREVCAQNKMNSAYPTVLSGYFPIQHNSPCLFSRQWEVEAPVLLSACAPVWGETWLSGVQGWGEAGEATHAFVSGGL